MIIKVYLIILISHTLFDMCISLISFYRDLLYKSTIMWLVGKEISRFSTAKLPSKQNVLSLFGHYHFTLHKTIPVSANNVTRDLVNVWSKYRIPTQDNHKIAAKVRSLFDSWRLLKNNKNNKKKESVSLQKRRDKFVDDNTHFQKR